MLVLELQSFKSVPQLDHRNEVDLFRAKYLMMQHLKFSPFISHINFIYWKNGGAKFDFYAERQDPMYSNSGGRVYSEHAIVHMVHED